jgi:hypothetical protein
MRENTIEELIKVSTEAVKDGVEISLIVQALIRNGFAPNRAEQIVRWAIMSNN